MSDPIQILNWRRLTAAVTTSGQPTEPQLVEIAELGVSHVVNLGLHTHERALRDEGASLSKLGLRYIHIPVAFDHPSEDDFSAFCEALDQAGDALVHVHCIVNLRVSAFFYRYRRDILRQDEAQARSAMETIWRPGGVWADFIGDQAAVGLPHRYAGRDY